MKLYSTFSLAIYPAHYSTAFNQSAGVTCGRGYLHDAFGTHINIAHRRRQLVVANALRVAVAKNAAAAKALHFSIGEENARVVATQRKGERLWRFHDAAAAAAAGAREKLNRAL